MNTQAQIFRTSWGFRLLYLVPLLLVLLALVTQVKSPAQYGWLLVLLAIVFSVMTVPRALTKVIVDDESLVVNTPLRKSTVIYLRQLVSVERSPRVGHALLLRYHPMDERGRLDIANQEFKGLPPLEQQEQLLDLLKGAVGEDGIVG
ncbi:MAG: hypothetical protein U9R25_14510 [Chloroflexota bacterium]|nr:hypothetical protein [Chloroflexota bacterium]